MIYTIAPSYTDERTIWVGTDDGLIHVTRDGGDNWQDVTPPALTPWSKVSIMDASHFDADTAYAAINTIRLDDLRPHIYRTRDGGKIVDAHHHRHSRRRHHQRGARGSEAARPAVRRRRADRLRVVRRRRSLAVAAPQPAGDVDSRPGDQRRRPRDRHARPIVLHSRRHHAAAADRRGHDVPRTCTCSRRSRRGASAGTRTPTRRCRRTNRRGRTRPTARSCTTT